MSRSSASALRDSPAATLVARDRHGHGLPALGLLVAGVVLVAGGSSLTLKLTHEVSVLEADVDVATLFRRLRCRTSRSCGRNRNRWR